MSIEAIKTVLVYLAALTAGIVTSLVSLITPMKQEVPQLMRQPTPTPYFTESTRELSREESTTMSASFIKEFETLVSSGSGERR